MFIEQNEYDSPWIKVNNANFESKFESYKIGTHTFYNAGETIYFQGDSTNTFFYLKKGRVKAFILEKNGTEKILSIHEPGNFFGETATIDLLPRPCCASAMTKSEIIILSPANFHSLLKLDPDLGLNIMKSLARKVRLLSYQVQDMAFLEAEQSIAHLLLKFSNDFGTVTPKGIKLSINFTEQDLAGLAGICRVTVAKTLNTFKKAGFIEKGYRNIIIKNQMGLLKYLYGEKPYCESEKREKA